VANFIAERSVIGAAPFVTRFNTGEGDRVFRRGRVVGAEPWFNLGAQDILPTWAWWTRPLHAPFDRDHDAAGLLCVDYDFTDAWDGGASLRVSGPLSAESATEIRLFKTKLAVTPDLDVGLVAKHGEGGVVRLGLIFEDAPDVVEWLTVTPGDALDAGWWRWRRNLGRHAGRTLAALSLGVDAASAEKAFAVNIGELSLTAGPAQAVGRPDGFRIAAARVAPDGRSAELRLQWTYDPSVAHYDLFAGDGAPRVWLGRITGDSYYVAALQRPTGAKPTVLHLIPTATDGGAPDAGAAATFDWTA
jgi:hypothetical protein